MKTDVLIVGAGPTGLALALQLIRYDIDFMIIDRKETTTPYSKAIGVQARTLEIYDQIGIADELVERGSVADRVRLIEGGDVRGEIDLNKFGQGMSPFPFLLIVEQGKHEELLYDHIRQHGHDVEWLTELVKFAQGKDGVTADIKRKDGTFDAIEARYLVGCDGAHSLVRHGLGIEFGGSTFERLFYVADVDLDWSFEHDALHVNLGKNTLTAFFPMVGENRWRVVGTFPEGHSAEEGEVAFDEIERQVIADTKLTFDVMKVNWFSTYKVHSRHVNKFSEGRCFLAGDSAHIHTPAGAQGMNTGIQDGYNLAWKLATVLRSGSELSLLDTYNEERLPNAHRLLQTTDRFFALAASDEPVVTFFRLHILPYIANIALNIDAVKRIVFPLISQIGINYRKSSLSTGGDEFKIKAGDRMPYFVVDGASIYDRLREPRFRLLVFSDGSTNIDKNVEAEVLPLYPLIAETFGANRTFCVLLRPDNYIGYIGMGVDVAAVNGYLARMSSKAATAPE